MNKVYKTDQTVVFILQERLCILKLSYRGINRCKKEINLFISLTLMHKEVEAVSSIRNSVPIIQYLNNVHVCTYGVQRAYTYFSLSRVIISQIQVRFPCSSE